MPGFTQLSWISQFSCELSYFKALKLFCLPFLSLPGSMSVSKAILQSRQAMFTRFDPPLELNTRHRCPKYHQWTFQNQNPNHWPTFSRCLLPNSGSISISCFEADVFTLLSHSLLTTYQSFTQQPSLFLISSLILVHLFGVEHERPTPLVGIYGSQNRKISDRTLFICQYTHFFNRNGSIPRYPLIIFAYVIGSIFRNDGQTSLHSYLSIWCSYEIVDIRPILSLDFA